MFITFMIHHCCQYPLFSLIPCQKPHTSNKPTVKIWLCCLYRKPRKVYEICQLRLASVGGNKWAHCIMSAGDELRLLKRQEVAHMKLLSKFRFQQQHREVADRSSGQRVELRNQGTLWIIPNNIHRTVDML